MNAEVSEEAVSVVVQPEGEAFQPSDFLSGTPNAQCTYCTFAHVDMGPFHKKTHAVCNAAQEGY